MLKRRARGGSGRGPLACVMGDMDLVRPLGLAGVRCVPVAQPGEIVRSSRFASAAVDWVDSRKHPKEMLARLLRFAEGQREHPVLYYGSDWDLLLVSRNRARLEGAFRFVVPSEELVEDLVDKARFQALVDRLGLPVPPSRLLPASNGSGSADLDLPFPLVVKPVTRYPDQWRLVAGAAKAVRVDDAVGLRELRRRLSEAGVDAVAQSLVEGAETLIESYHVYVDHTGAVVGEFTGQKIRTLPEAYGFSTAVVITQAPDVRALGLELTRRLALTGVAKFDFKRAPDGTLHLLEVNPRFNLWHHPGALAGVNLPALVYDDLVGRPRRSPPKAQPGVRWCYHRHDLRAARLAGIPFFRWLAWALACEAKSALAWDDPAPAFHALAGPLARRAASLRKRPARPMHGSSRLRSP